MKQIIAGVLAIFITLPIYFYLFYKVLEAVNASELMWFLYWVYVPCGLIVSILTKMIEAEK